MQDQGHRTTGAAPLWAGLTAEEHEFQYNPQRSVPDFKQFQARREGPNAEAKARLRCIAGETDSQGVYCDLGADYEYAVVGHPGRKYLWILSRTRTMDAAVYSGILERLRAQGYDVSRLQVTLQPK